MHCTSSQPVLGGLFWYRPDGQTVHSLLAAAALNIPGLQFAHALALPARENLPAAHSTQSLSLVLPLGEDSPAAQAMHSAAPSSL